MVAHPQPIMGAHLPITQYLMVASNVEIGLYGQSGELLKGGGNSNCQTERVNHLLLLE